MPGLIRKILPGQAGFTLLEVLIAMAMGITVMSGVVSVLVVSKNNFTTERELATLQENARFAIKFMGDEIKMAGYNGCGTAPLNVANSININADNNWFLNGTGLEGYEHFTTEAGRSSFPAAFRDDVAINTDAIVIRRGEQEGLRVNGNHNSASAVIQLSAVHGIQRGTVMVMTTPDCQQVGIFQMSGPNSSSTSNMVHNTGSMSPGNCTHRLGGNFNCSNLATNCPTPPNTACRISYPRGSSVMRMKSEAFYIGTSSVGNGIPALFRETLGLNAATQTAITTSEELVQGVENMQISYGVDTNLDGLANIYLDADDGAMDWGRVVSVRLSLRMRSTFPVYNENIAYDEFMGIADTDGSDRFMRQLVTTTIQLRNR